MHVFFAGFVLVFQYLAKRLVGKNFSKMTYFCVGWDVKPYSINLEVAYWSWKFLGWLISVPVLLINSFDLVLVFTATAIHFSSC